MMKRINTIFISICFLAALLAEIYFIQRQSQDLVTIIGIGIVVLILGYLTLDSLRNLWRTGSEKTKFILEKTYQEESERWEERYAELIKLQKATYAVTKKNALLQEQFKEIQARLDENEILMQKLMELQKKSMEGQKNALNMEMNYNKENTKRILGAIRSEVEKLNPQKQLMLLQELVEKSGKEKAVTTNKAVVPLYDDPNKNLTVDEIANLFNSYNNN